jgi:hypothetical protein
MSWQKLGLIFDLKKHPIPWLKSHAMIPTPLLLDDKIRIYYAGRDSEGKSKISYVDVSREDPTRILYVHDRPLFDVGPIGTFDDSGTLCTCAVRNGDAVLLYYTAYSMSVLVPYRNAIGVAISHDKGETFARMYDGPIVDRNRAEPYFTISPWVLREDTQWHMWYASATGWIMVDGKPESLYHIKYAHSSDGIEWQRKNESCILPVNKDEANARPTVIKEGTKLKMWFCYRGSIDFRNGQNSYRLGYAEADISNPTHWKRKDREAGISCGPEDFDNAMQAYPAVLDIAQKRYLFYNGNGFGINGFCCALWI